MPRPAPSRVAAALDYLERLKSQAAEFGGGVVENLADRARSVGGLAYEALTSDPNMGRMTTAEFSEAASRPTPRLDQAAQDLGTIGRAIVTQPIQTGKAIVQGEIDRAQEATTSPRAAGEYAGSFIDPMRIAAALRRTAPVLELDVYHGTPHRFPATKANPLGEFDASKIGTGEGAQYYGHGIYYAESPTVAQGYKTANELTNTLIDGKQVDFADPRYQAAVRISTQGYKKALDTAIKEAESNFLTAEGKAKRLELAEQIKALRGRKVGSETTGSLYKADLPDEMIDRMLDWDKPLSEQSAVVKNLHPRLVNESDKFEKRFKIETNIPLKNGGTAIFPLTEYYKTPEDAQKAFETLSGLQIYQRLSKVSGPQEISKQLKKFGIPGIRYLDAGSRDGGSGTRNFVVFPGEEKKVRILERK